MRLPVIPFVVAVTLLAAVWYLFTASKPGHLTLDVPRLSRLTDIDGVETEVAVTPDGKRLAVVVSGDLWVLDQSGGMRKQLTRTTEPESFPNWTPDGKRITFTRSGDTFVIDPETGAETLFRSNATSLSWSHTSRTTFVQDRALWIANPNDQDGQKLVDADMIPDVDIRTPRFSPDALQIAYIKS
jgi:Tol biopolymer transport system component